MLAARQGTLTQQPRASSSVLLYTLRRAALGFGLNISSGLGTNSRIWFDVRISIRLIGATAYIPLMQGGS